MGIQVPVTHQQLPLVLVAEHAAVDLAVAEPGLTEGRGVLDALDQLPRADALLFGEPEAELFN